MDFINAKYKKMGMLPYERYKLYNWILDIKSKGILEVGTGNGGSTTYMAAAIKKLGSRTSIHTCDVERYINVSFFTTYPSIKFHRMPSEMLIPKLIRKKECIDFIFFDGPEYPEVAMKDILILEQYINDGTYFSMHDWEYTKRGYDGGTSVKAQTIRPYIEQSDKWIKVEVLSGLCKNSSYNEDLFDSVGLCLYKFKK
jgi:hypothetical protein